MGIDLKQGGRLLNKSKKESRTEIERDKCDHIWQISPLWQKIINIFGEILGVIWQNVDLTLVHFFCLRVNFRCCK